MFHCERCGIRFSTGALSGRRDCPRCRSRDGVVVLLTWEPLLSARTAAAISEASRQAQSPRSTSISPNFSASSSAS
jgi:predicted  nucleic acid-binding Zn-ribbon protein